MDRNNNRSRLSIKVLTILIIALLLISCGGKPETVTDIDGNVYKTVIIGNQEWMAENLKVTHFRNGDIIPYVTDGSQWVEQSIGAYCVYDNSETNFTTYGYLYNWFALNDPRGLGTEGWHVPTDDDLKELEIYLGMSQSKTDSIGWREGDAGNNLKEAGTSHWASQNKGATNSSGFSALPGGCCLYNSGQFNYIGLNAAFWASSEKDSTRAWTRVLRDNGAIDRGSQNKIFGFSVRLVRDR